MLHLENSLGAPLPWLKMVAVTMVDMQFFLTSFCMHCNFISSVNVCAIN